MSRAYVRAVLSAIMAVVLAAAVTGCAGWGGGAGGGGANSINVLMVNNPQMIDLQRLTADHFSRETGIEVNFTVLPENDVRDKISQEFSSQAGQYDVASLSNFEIPIYAKSEWIAPLDEYVGADTQFNQADILAPMTQSLTAEDGKIYGEPFYGESSFLMYRKDIFEAKGVTLPEKPTWQQVAEAAQKVATPEVRGICLRGQPGWGQVMAPLTTVVNTFGGTWFTKDWQAQVNAPEFKEATKFYVDLVRNYGEAGAPQAGFAECLNNMTQGKVAMWYDATVAAGLLEANDSPVKGKLGFTQAPVVKTDSSGWLYTWAFGIQKASKKQEQAWKFISWASGKGYEELVGKNLGWSKLPDGKRSSTYQRAEYKQSSGSFSAMAEAAIKSAKPLNPGVQERPAPGIQFVGIPEFTDLGTQVSQQISSAIAGAVSVDDALNNGQGLAEKVAAKYKGQ